jgi:hypothetical protein
MQMCGYNGRRVRPAHTMSIGPGDMLQFRDTRPGSHTEASVRLTSHIDRACEPLILCLRRLQLQPISSTHAYALSEVQNAAEVAEGGMVGIASQCAAKLLYAVRFRAGINWPHACM